MSIDRIESIFSEIDKGVGVIHKLPLLLYFVAISVDRVDLAFHGLITAPNAN